MSKFFNHLHLQVVYIRPEEVSEPSLSAEWLDGSRQHVDLNGKSPAEISETFELLSAQATAEEMIYRPKSSSTQMPSIQGFNYHCLIDKKPLGLTELPGTSFIFLLLEIYIFCYDEFFLSGANLVNRTPPRGLKISTQTLLEDIAKGWG